MASACRCLEHNSSPRSGQAISSLAPALTKKANKPLTAQKMKRLIIGLGSLGVVMLGYHAGRVQVQQYNPQPSDAQVISGVCGSMYAGVDNGTGLPVVRYEDQQTYGYLSA
jgi:hypothetical protein